MNASLKHMALLLFASIVPFACSSSRSAGSEGEQEVAPEETTDKDVRELEIREDGWDEKGSDPFRFEKVRVDGDLLELQVRYSGGCKEHRFRLMSDKAYSKSSPPSVQLFLSHNANGDACRSLITDTLRYQLRKLRHPDSDKLILHLHGSDQQLRYVY